MASLKEGKFGTPDFFAGLITPHLAVVQGHGKKEGFAAF